MEICSLISCRKCHSNYFNNKCFGFGQMSSFYLVWHWSCCWLPSSPCIRPSPLLVHSHWKSLRCVCWWEQRLWWLTRDSVKNLTALASLLFYCSSFFLFFRWLLLSEGKIFQTASLERSLSVHCCSNDRCGTHEWETIQWLSKTASPRTQHRKRDKRPTLFYFHSNYLNPTTATF